MTPLSPRQVEALKLCMAGFGDKQIALRLGVSERTGRYVDAAVRRIGARNRCQAGAIMARLDMAKPAQGG